ncbi:MAG: exodeoxyribonuclease VII large subunit [Phycisphaerales bacterium]|nr:exodeoxyribonuclease VII large subunit [Phycisphaerales bacterium]
MARLPFDPTKMAGAKAPARDAGVLTVMQLSQRLGDTIQAGFPSPVRVVGEVSGFKPGSHWYFSLKDAESVVPCVMFGQAVRVSGFTPVNGHEVVVTGRPDYWGKGGRTSLLVTKIEPVGEGVLDAAFRALCNELREAGWFDEARKRPIPAFPGRVAVVTSGTGAALQDVLETMRRRCRVAEVILLDVPVQGQGAADAVAAAVRWAGRVHSREGIDVILVTRGGGSKEDLWTFNERVVAAAIRESPVPVVAAIGHEVDTTIAELVADLRCATPTQAAVRLTPDSAALLDQLAARGNQLRRTLTRFVRDSGARAGGLARVLGATTRARLGRERHRLDLAGAALERVRPTAVLAARWACIETLAVRLRGAIRGRTARPALEVLADRLERAARGLVPRRTERLSALERHLGSVGPAGVLERGFSYTRREDGRLVRSPADVRPGDRVVTRVADGSFGSVVEGSPARRPARVRPRADTGEFDLFGGGG